jgi:hypothetical protein
MKGSKMLKFVEHTEVKGKIVEEVKVKDTMVCYIYQDQTYTIFQSEHYYEDTQICCFYERSEQDLFYDFGYQLVELGIASREEYDSMQETHDKKWKEKDLIRKREQLEKLKKELGEI